MRSMLRHPETRIWFLGTSIVGIVAGVVTMPGIAAFATFMIVVVVPVTLATTWNAHKRFGPRRRTPAGRSDGRRTSGRAA
jgi:hypothetical protein